MKFSITVKDPDGVWDGVMDAARESVKTVAGVDKDELDDIIDSRRIELLKSIRKWIKYDEYITVEFDTDAHTATVVKT